MKDHDTKQEENSQKLTSIRKMYLNKRAELIRESFFDQEKSIAQFIKQVETGEFNATKDEMLFAKALHWMQKNLHTEASINDLSKFLSVSVRKVQRLFSFFLKKPYTTVLLDMKITAAKGYLQKMKHSIGEISFLVGIKDHAYFTYLFRKTTGMTPTEYRLSLMQHLDFTKH